MLVAILNGIFRVIEFLAQFIILAFPVSPFQWEFTMPEYARWIGAIIPFSEMAVFMTSYVAAVLMYYVIRTAARWVKMVGS